MGTLASPYFTDEPTEAPERLTPMPGTVHQRLDSWGVDSVTETDPESCCMITIQSWRKGPVCLAWLVRPGANRSLGTWPGLALFVPTY